MRAILYVCYNVVIVLFSYYDYSFLQCRLFYCVFFFFFKQKTAYEMRISDWSSDVCSSDLWTRALTRPIEATTVHPRRINPIDRIIADIGIEIGRASCRERVCQYV